MDGLGRLFNIGPATGDAAWTSMKNCRACSFLCILAAGDTYTLAEAKTAGGGSAQNLAAITRYYTTTVDGLSAWAENLVAATNNVVTTATTQGAMVFSISGGQLDAGFFYLRVTSTGAGLVIPIQHDLYQQRNPANMPLALGT